MTILEWFAIWWPLVSPVALVILTTSGAGIWGIINRRGGEKAKTKHPLPPTWPEMWARLDAQEKDNRELRERIEALENQGEKDKKRMTEMEAHIETLEELVPPPPPPRPWERGLEQISLN